MKDKQFDKFWEIKCPYCGKRVDLEILVNIFDEVKTKKERKNISE